MKIYSAHGINDFIICRGYKGHKLKQYFANYFLYKCDCAFDLKKNHVEILRNQSPIGSRERWQTGAQT